MFPYEMISNSLLFVKLDLLRIRGPTVIVIIVMLVFAGYKVVIVDYGFVGVRRSEPIGLRKGVERGVIKRILEPPTDIVFLIYSLI